MLANKACVSGVGETVYQRGSAKTAFELQIEASLQAITDAGLTPKDIDGVIPIGIVSGTAEDFIDNFGIPDLRFSALIPHGGASPAIALQTASESSQVASATIFLLLLGAA